MRENAGGLSHGLFFAPYVTACFIVFGLATGIAILATGSEISEIAYIVGRYFGQRAFGLIYGIMVGAFQLGSAIAAPFMGYYHDSYGDYIGALWAVVALVLVGAGLIAALSDYPKKCPDEAGHQGTSPESLL